MDQNLANLLTNRMKYLNILEKDINQTELQCEKERQEIAKYESVIENITHLQERPKWNSMLQLSKRVFVPGNLKHTGEYMVHMQGYPTSYRTLHTAKHTIEYLDKKVAEHKKNVEVLETNKKQLNERSKLFLGKDNSENISDSDNKANSDLPNEIVSDKGVAVRVGEFYEIIECEES